MMIGGGTLNLGEGRNVVDVTVEGALMLGAMKDILLSMVLSMVGAINVSSTNVGAINVSSTNVSVLGSIGEASRGEPHS
jgi:hypothetical protein